MIPYKVVIVNELLPIQTYVSEDERIDFLPVGKQFHGRHFKGERPLLFIDQTTESVFENYDEEYVREWLQYIRGSLSKGRTVKVVGNGLFADLIRQTGGKLIHDSFGTHYRLN